MTNKPLVSIIIPTYNRAHLIGETLDSVLAQTYTNWECIVVDDGSTDATDEVMQGYMRKDARFQYHHRPEGHLYGGNGARNYGFILSKGEFIQWFDSDDVMKANTLAEKIILALFHNADVVVTAHEMVRPIMQTEEPTVEVFCSGDFYIDYILGKKSVITDDVLIRKTIVKTCRFDEQLHKAQEFDFFSRLFNQPLTYCFSNQVLVWYRTNNNSINRQIGRDWLKKQESLIYLSKKLIDANNTHAEIVERMYRQGRKTYKSLASKNKIRIVFKNYEFFRKAHNKTTLLFFLWVIYNVVTGRGFDRVNQKVK